MNKTEVKVELEEKKLPLRWVMCKLGNVIERMEDGGTPPREDLTNFNGEIPWVVIDDIKKRIFSTRDTLSKEGLKICNAKLWKKGSIILSFGATIGKVGIAEVDLSTKQGIVGIEVKIDKIYNNFLYYALLTKKNELLRYSNGTTIKEIRPETIKEKIKLLFPSSIPEQQKIVEILNIIDETIEKTDAIIEKYKRIQQGLIQDLLTRGIDENGQIRNEDKHKFKDSSLGRIPKKWEVVESGHRNITSLITDGSHFSPQSFDDSEHYIATIENIKNNKIDISSCKKISKKDYEYLQRNNCKPRIDDILFTKDGTIGIVFKFAQKEKLVLLSSIAIIRIQKILLPDYLVQYLRSNFVWKQLEILAGGSALKRVVLRDLKKILILLPSLPEQQRISLILSQMDETIEKEENYREKLKRIKQGLMEDLLTGKVRVNLLIKEDLDR